MDFRTAAETKLTFGRYIHMTIDEVASDDEGLRYLDWLRGEAKSPKLKELLSTYLDDPTIYRELKAALDQ